MFEKVNVPVYGLVENMAYFQCRCGEKSYIFGKEGCQKLAKEVCCDDDDVVVVVGGVD